MSTIEQQRTLWNEKPPKQFLKWVGNKQRFAPEIVSYAPDDYRVYIEPFLGSGAVLGALGPREGIAGDNHPQLVALWLLLKNHPESLAEHYGRLREEFLQAPKEVYERVKASYNANPNPHDLLFISRSCYAGVVRFRKKDGGISTPIGPHTPISQESLIERMTAWGQRIRSTEFILGEYAETMELAKKRDLVYCDPPYSYSQAILYGAQDFRLHSLFDAIEQCKRRGARVMLSIDGKKKSGKFHAHLEIPDGLFAREMLIDCGRSMLRRFQRGGDTLEDEVVHDRLLLTW